MFNECKHFFDFFFKFSMISSNESFDSKDCTSVIIMNRY